VRLQDGRADDALKADAADVLPWVARHVCALSAPAASGRQWRWRGAVIRPRTVVIVVVIDLDLFGPVRHGGRRIA
jgi:hypothetical protein